MHTLRELGLEPGRIGNDRFVYDDLSKTPIVGLYSNDGFSGTIKSSRRLITDDEYEVSTFPFVNLNRGKKIRWLVATCSMEEYNSCILKMEHNKAPIPYRLCGTFNGICVFYWKLKDPIWRSLTGQTKAEICFKKTYHLFCEANGLRPCNNTYITYNPLYIGYETVLYQTTEYGLKSFIVSNYHHYKRNQSDNVSYLDGKDYLFHETRKIARERYLEHRPSACEYGEFEEYVLNAMLSLDFSPYPDAVCVDHDALAGYIANYYIRHFDDVMRDFSNIQRKRVSKRWERNRKQWAAKVEKVIQLKLEGHTNRYIAARVGCGETSVRRWCNKFLKHEIYHDQRYNTRYREVKRTGTY